MFQTPKNSNVCLQGTHLPVNLTSDFFSSVFFLIKKTPQFQTLNAAKCHQCATLISFSIGLWQLWQMFWQIMRTLDSSQTWGKVAHSLLSITKPCFYAQDSRLQNVSFIFIIPTEVSYWQYRSQILSIFYTPW